MKLIQYLSVVVLAASSSFNVVDAAKCPFSGKENAAGVCPHTSISQSSSSPFTNTPIKSLNKPEITNKGCTCKSTCGATVTQGLSNCDWCYTENNCGRFGITGYWDYCNYLLDTTYEAQTADQKFDFLWSLITNGTEPVPPPNVLGIFDESVQTSFGNQRDWAPDNRVKYIHGQGVICPSVLSIDGPSPYTGLFSTGTKAKTFIRLGPANPITLTSGIQPGLGIKFMRDSVPSGNFVLLHSLDPLPDNNYNFFAANFSNHLPKPQSSALELLEKKFQQASECPLQVGLSDICAFNADGSAVSNVVFPFRVDLQSREFQLPSTPVSQADLLQNISTIPVNTRLFEITAYDTPSSFKNGNGVRIGILTTIDECTTSTWGDASMFFQHQGIESDWSLHPEWITELDPEADCGIPGPITVQGPAFCSEL